MLFKPARKIAAAAAVALAAGTVGALAAPATAVTPTLDYTCEAPGGPYTFKVVADTTLPETATTGQALTGTATYTVTIPDALRNLIYGVTNSRFVEGTAAINATAFGAPAALTGAVPKTPIPAAGDFQVVATSPVSLKAPATAGAATIVAGNFDTTVKLTKDEAGTPGDIVSETTIKCVLAAGQNAVVDTVQVSAPTTTTPQPPAPAKVDTATTVKAKFAKKKKTITAVVKVKGTDATKGTGRVKVTLKLGKKKVKTINAKLAANGVAKAVFKKITKKGKYKLQAVYAGSATQNGSKGKATLKVK